MVGIIVNNRFDRVDAVMIDGHGHLPVAGKNSREFQEDAVGVGRDRNQGSFGGRGQRDLHTGIAALRRYRDVENFRGIR